MNNLSLRPVLFLIIGVLVAVGGLLQALHEEAFAIPECSVVCVCDPAPCEGAVEPNKRCGDSHLCNGAPGSPARCMDYCIQQW